MKKRIQFLWMFVLLVPVLVPLSGCGGETSEPPPGAVEGADTEAPPPVDLGEPTDDTSPAAE